MKNDLQTTDKALQDGTDLRRIKNIINMSEVISRGGKFVAVSMKDADEIAALIERILA